MSAPSHRLNIAFPFSQIKLEEPSKELAELAALVFDLVGDDGRVGPRGPARGSAGTGAGAAGRAALKRCAARSAVRQGAAPRPSDSPSRRIGVLEEQLRLQHRVAPVPEHLEADGADERRPRLDDEHHLLDRHAGQEPLAHGRHRCARARPTPSVVTLVRAEAARLLGRHQRAHQGRGHPGVGLDGVLGRLVARDRGAEDQPPLVRVLEGPAPQGARDRQPTLGVAGRPGLRVCRCLRLIRRPLRLGGQRLVGGEDQRCQQRVPSVEVAVQRRGGHPQVTGDGAQGESGGTVTGDVRAGHGQDLRRHLLPDPLPGRAWGGGCGWRGGVGHGAGGR